MHLIITLTVTTRKDSHRFQASVFSFASPEDFHLDPTDFYEKWGKSVPHGIHHEVEILQPSNAEMKKHALHIHASRKTGKPFMCYPLHIKTPDRARELFKVWCLGTILKITEGVDLNTLYSGECGDDAVKFTTLMKERYGIAIAKEEITPVNPHNISEYLNRMSVDTEEILKILLDAPLHLTGTAEPALFTTINTIKKQLGEAKKIWRY